MSNGVEFDVDNMQYGTRRPAPGANIQGGGFSGGGFTSSNEPKMVQWLMRKGIVKSPGQAQYILLGVVVVNIIIMIVVVKFFL